MKFLGNVFRDVGNFLGDSCDFLQRSFTSDANIENKNYNNSQSKLQEQKEQRNQAIDHNQSGIPKPRIESEIKYILILQIPADQTSIINSNKKTINLDVFEQLYQSTKYLCQAISSILISKWNDVDLYKVKAGEESEYDIYLVRIDLNQPDERFNAEVNQIDRINAFRDLPNRASNVQVSDRLKMEAGTTFNLYSR